MYAHKYVHLSLCELCSPTLPSGNEFPTSKLTALGVRDKQGAVQNFFLLLYFPSFFQELHACCLSSTACCRHPGCRSRQAEAPAPCPPQFLALCIHRPPLPPLLLKPSSPSIFSLLIRNLFSAAPFILWQVSRYTKSFFSPPRHICH